MLRAAGGEAPALTPQGASDGRTPDLMPLRESCGRRTGIVGAGPSNNSDTEGRKLAQATELMRWTPPAHPSELTPKEKPGLGTRPFAKGASGAQTTARTLRGQAIFAHRRAALGRLADRALGLI